MGHHHAPKLSVAAMLVMGSVAVTYFGLKSPIKNKWASESRISPKSDLAWRNSADQWVENHKGHY